MDVVESASTGSNVQDAIVGFEMLIFKVEQNMSANRGLGTVIIVFSVIGAEAHVGVCDVDSTIGDEEVALLLLWAAGGDFCRAAGSGGQADLLSITRAEGSQE